VIKTRILTADDIQELFNVQSSMFKVLKRSLFGAFLPHLDTAPAKIPSTRDPAQSHGCQHQ
jgi:hypothetical protein